MALTGTNKRIVITLAIVVIAIAVVLVIWNKPRRNVADEESVKISSAQLVKEYQENENAANAKYLDKAIQVTGIVNDVSVNQDGKQTIMLSSDDAMTGVFCTLKEKGTNINNGSSITIKGFCSGMLSDVRLREAVVVK